MISSLFQALNLAVTGRQKVSCNFCRYIRACKTGTGFKSQHSFIADVRIWAREPHVWKQWFHLAETTWWRSDRGFSPHSTFFSRHFAQATHSGVSISLSMKWEYPGGIIFHIVNHLEKHYENWNYVCKTTNSLGGNNWVHAKCYHYERNYLTGYLFWPTTSNYVSSRSAGFVIFSLKTSTEIRWLDYWEDTAPNGPHWQNSILSCERGSNDGLLTYLVPVCV